MNIKQLLQSTVLVLLSLSAASYVCMGFIGKDDSNSGGRWSSTAVVNTGETSADLAVGTSISVQTRICGDHKTTGTEHNHNDGFYSIVHLERGWDPAAYNWGWCLIWEDPPQTGYATGHVF